MQWIAIQQFKKEEPVNTDNNVDSSHKHHVKKKNPGTARYIHCIGSLQQAEVTSQEKIWKWLPVYIEDWLAAARGNCLGSWKYFVLI